MAFAERPLKIISLLMLSLMAEPVFSQHEKIDAAKFTYEEYYDAPYDINKLFIHIQPLYGELFVTNVNIGFGLEVNYYLRDKFDFSAQARRAYTRSFDFERNVASKSSSVDNIPQVYNYFEAGATYHVIDREHDTETKIILYSDSFKGNKWASRIPEYVKVPSKVRKITGARLGGLVYNSTTDLNRALSAQGISLKNDSENPIDPQANIFGNVDVMGFYLGGSMAWIKNFAIKPDKGYGILSNDLIFTSYFDVLFAPSVKVEDVIYQDQIFSSKPIKVNKMGFRLGMNGKFNREFSWGYGAEIGYRPGVQGRGFFTNVKFSLPIFGTDLIKRQDASSK
ncbi:hypothetical protein BH23BAC1_BH23BAC1_06410 [soil metagenome]